MGGKNSGRKKDRQKAAAKEQKKNERKPLNQRQSRFAIAYLRTRSLKKAALEAGYSPKNPSQSGAQVLAAIEDKAPEVMCHVGLTLGTIIKKYLVPLLEAEETKFAQFESKFTDSVETGALNIRLGATRMALELHGAIGGGVAASVCEETPRAGVDAFVVDIPRPGYGYASDDAIKLTPANPQSNVNKPKKEIPQRKIPGQKTEHA